MSTVTGIFSVLLGVGIEAGTPFDSHIGNFRQDHKGSQPRSVPVAGFLSRWNVTMATPIEPEPNDVREKYLVPLGWSAGEHKRD